MNPRPNSLDFLAHIHPHPHPHPPQSTKKAIKENIVIKNQLYTMTRRLNEFVVENEKLRTQNKRLRDLNLELNQSQDEMSKKYATNQKFLRIMVQKLKENDVLLNESVLKNSSDVQNLQILGPDHRRAKHLVLDMVKALSELTNMHTSLSGRDFPLSHEICRLAEDVIGSLTNKYVSEKGKEADPCLTIIFRYPRRRLLSHLLPR